VTREFAEYYIDDYYSDIPAPAPTIAVPVRALSAPYALSVTGDRSNDLVTPVKGCRRATTTLNAVKNTAIVIDYNRAPPNNNLYIVDTSAVARRRFKARFALDLSRPIRTSLNPYNHRTRSDNKIIELRALLILNSGLDSNGFPYASLFLSPSELIAFRISLNIDAID
jgi:hypothetical protein